MECFAAEILHDAAAFSTVREELARTSQEKLKPSGRANFSLLSESRAL